MWRHFAIIGSIQATQVGCPQLSACMRVLECLHEHPIRRDRDLTRRGVLFYKTGSRTYRTVFYFDPIMRFTHLHTHSHFSLLDGLSKIDDLIARAKELGMDALGITDHGNLYGTIEFYKKAKKAGIKPIIGCEMYITDTNRTDKTPADADRRWHLILLAKNDIGYHNLLKLVSAAYLEGFYYKPRIDREVLKRYSDGLIATSSCLAGEISRALLSDNYDKAKTIACEYEEILGKGNFFIELQQHFNTEEQNIVTPKLVTLARELNIPLTVGQDSHYLRKEDAQAHDVLLAVQTGSRTDDKDRLSMSHDDFSFISGQEMFEKLLPLGEDVAHEAIENTNRIADMCTVEIELDKPHLPKFHLPTGYTDDFTYLEELVQQGLKKRYGDNPKEEILKRLKYELSIIQETGFSSYFLIVQDFVNWAKNNGVVVGPGRGSAAGSLISYLLNITNIDPLTYNLLFERFLNPARISMPDIDIDFADSRRDEVLKYVTEKYGKDHVAQIITFGTMAARGGIRDAGRALGFSYDFCDRVAKMVPMGPQGAKEGLLACTETNSELKEAYVTNQDVKKLVDAAAQLEGVARHASTHACAVVITPKPLTEYLPLQHGTDEGSIITQYEMNAVQDLGLLKMDFLGLANLTIIEEAVNMIEKNFGIKIDVDNLPLNDEKTFRLLQAAKTTGVFQLESSGMKRYLKELEPTEIEDIIAMISLYRPGPMDLIPEYIACKHGRKKTAYLHPSLEPILKNTYGIMVYQEQLMAAVQVLAGFTLAEADIMRKAVGKKIKSLLDKQEGKFKESAKRVGTPDAVANKFWELVEPFNRYAFNRSHAACYAMIAYQTAYLKVHYPAEFMAAFMNSETGDVERIAFLIEEAEQMGIKILAPDVNESFQRFTVVSRTDKDAASAKQTCIRFGLTAVKNVGENIVQAIITERDANGPYHDVEDFIMRVHSKDMNRKSLESLIRCGALDAFGERNMLLTNLEPLLAYARDKQKQTQIHQASLFGEGNVELPPIKLLSVEQPAAKWEKLLWEKELLGLFVSEHPLQEFQPTLALEKVIPIKDIAKQPAAQPVKIGGMITRTQKIITKSGRPMVFSWLEDVSSKIEVVVFPNVLEKDPDIWKENQVVVIRGRVNDRDGTLKFLCDSVKPIASLA